jgi:hypothetical protein
MHCPTPLSTVTLPTPNLISQWPLRRAVLLIPLAHCRFEPLGSAPSWSKTDRFRDNFGTGVEFEIMRSGRFMNRGFESLPHRFPRMTLEPKENSQSSSQLSPWNKRRISHRTHVWIDFVLGIIGLVLAAIGWLFQYAEQIPWFEKIAAPQYVAAMNCYDQMIKSHKPLSRGAPGFAEIEMLLHEKMTGPIPHPQLTMISIPKDNVAIFGEPAGTGVVIDVIAQSDQGTIMGNGIRDMRPEIRKRFLEQPIIRRGGWLFLVGLFVSASALVHSLWRGTRH